jgi:ComF family protein
MKVIKWCQDFWELFYPRYCVVCGTILTNTEKGICITCLSRLPRIPQSTTATTTIEKRFWGKIKIEQAIAYFYYERGSDFDRILFQIKYHGQYKLAAIMGRYIAADLVRSGFFTTIEAIIPIPLHKKRLKQRGYNQSEWLAKGVAMILKCPVYPNAVQRLVNTSTQTRKNAWQRWENVHQVFRLKSPDLLENKHVLLVDDVLTTGATLLACMQEIQQVKGVKISILTLAAVR